MDRDTGEGAWFEVAAAQPILVRIINSDTHYWHKLPSS